MTRERRLMGQLVPPLMSPRQATAAANQQRPLGRGRGARSLLGESNSKTSAPHLKDQLERIHKACLCQVVPQGLTRWLKSEVFRKSGLGQDGGQLAIDLHHIIDLWNKLTQLTLFAINA
ncbi:hypothetical protein EYF80_018566 [Liparis tanakae]|uniref:Uncharacterized protein n=1 Tax=Liparis tanakae TaxID=230148 RepID=A0A4Z2HZW9_9TELE|nr:hypothetical protein EYF80_018566 [Liparis tanakae]